MTTSLHTASHPFDATLRFFDSTAAPLHLVVRTLELTKLGSEVIEIRLAIEADPALHRRLSDAGLLGLQRELRRPAGAEIATETSVCIDVVLGAGMLVRLSGCTMAADAADMLLRWNRAEPTDQLFATESWFATAVRPTSGGEGYTTLWADIAPSRLARELSNRGIASLFEAVSAAAGIHSARRDSDSEKVTPLLEQVINYLQFEGWSYLRTEEQAALQLAYQGENGTWTCFARAYETEHQLVFYSVCPVRVPESRRANLAEFLTLANYGMIVGNFELDLADGEVRYKTYLDATEGPLVQTAIRRSIAPNVQMMDRYLPSILAVITGDLSPLDAIALAENKERQKD